ncbi:hypothetical protein KYTH83_14960 [Helicobacter pylori]
MALGIRAADEVAMEAALLSNPSHRQVQKYCDFEQGRLLDDRQTYQKSPYGLTW